MGISFSNFYSPNCLNDKLVELNSNNILIEKYYLMFLKQNQITMFIDYNSVRLYTLKKLFNILTNETIFQLNNDIFLTYIINNKDVIDKKIIFQYMQNTISKSAFFSKITDENWLADFYYIFYFDSLNNLDNHRITMNSFKKPYDNMKTVNINYCYYLKNKFNAYLETVDITEDEILNIFQKIPFNTLNNNVLLIKLAERYPYLFFKVVKYISISHRIFIDSICSFLIDKLWYTPSYKII